MAKNLLKRNFFFPRNLKTDKMYLKHGYTYKDSATKISVHFENQSCNFYVFLNQLPEYIIEETKLFQEQSKIALKKGSEDDSMLRIVGNSIEALEKKVKDLCTAYINESFKIERKRKIAINFYNNFKDNKLNINIDYTIFIEKTYFKTDSSIDKVVNVNPNSAFETELLNIKGQIFDYSEELEKNINEIQSKLNSSMDTFIKMLGEGDNFLENLKNHKLLER